MRSKPEREVCKIRIKDAEAQKKVLSPDDPKNKDLDFLIHAWQEWLAELERKR